MACLEEQQFNQRWRLGLKQVFVGQSFLPGMQAFFFFQVCVILVVICIVYNKYQIHMPRVLYDLNKSKDFLICYEFPIKLRLGSHYTTQTCYH